MPEKALNPSMSLFDNGFIYNTFAHHPAKKQELFDYLAGLFELHVKNPDNMTATEKLKRMAQLPDHMLIYFMVEIDKIITEGDCFAFEKREPGCLAAFFRGFSAALSKLNQPTFPSGDDNEKPGIDKRLHAVNTDSKQVQMEQITEKDPGHYRNYGTEYLKVEARHVSLEGIKYLIHLIAGDSSNKNGSRLSDMRIGCGDHFDRIYELTDQRDALTIIIALAGQADGIHDHHDNTAIVKFFNQFVRDKFSHIYENDLSESEVMAIFSMARKGLCDLFDRLLLLDTVTDKNVIKTAVNTLRDASSLQLMMKALKQIRWLLEEHKDYLDNGIRELTKQARRFRPYIVSHKDIPFTMKRYGVDSLDELAKKLYEKIRSKVGGSLHIHFPAASQVDSLMKELKQECSPENIELMKNKNIDEKLYFLYEIIQLMLLVHPFVDANNRTYVNEVAPRLHMQLQMVLPVYFNPFVFYAHSLAEVVETVKLSMANCLAMQEIVRSGRNPGFDFREGLLSNQQREQMANFVKPFRSFIEDLIMNENRQYIIGKIILSCSQQASAKDVGGLFDFRSIEEKTFARDIKQIKLLTSMKDIIQYLRVRVEQFEQSHTGIAKLYMDILAHLPNPVSTLNKRLQLT